MQHARIAIVGGGLSGLYAAALLEERGIHDYVVLEARETFGGRIVSWPDASRNHDDGTAERSIMGRFDLGATWYWPAMHPALQQLVQQLGLETVGNPPAFSEQQKWSYAAIASFIAGVMPPSAMLGRSWL